MDARELRALQTPFKQRYQQDPQSALVTLTASATINLPTLTCRLEQTGPSFETTGLHPMAGGDGLSACAADMMLQALAGCAGVTFAAVATALEIPVTTARLRIEGDLDFRGTLGISRDVPVGFQEIRVQFELTADAPDEKLTKAVELAERYCVVAQSLKAVKASWKRGET
ncbi:OsmC family protein [Planctomicrobium piriforme]|uniref:Uncharacterized OsmC-related protein n=1 Tax=Planctomicrobium piriforme TaxID=1576369 RepID=A0A1I3SMN4_9PLAN|nr:OsmC family protein [Planctomicrobium piriforme]SFJ59680.1 Uncharacterized OsmC-related protein [Planctomicrobium piriforme]